ncbi:hypothetical protein SporoP37_13890 [Sporosarcina sp. P37]|uniref:YkyA family protein n=1 Tax=unclassified Sporosarcina TaxID=2647733 RepID=UPI0009C2B759|nr:MULTISPECIES: YkyA family protein [unclassified Sporosarcina]ARD49158.1 hypothetical protein SporoP33_13550 [Sporosarcina sp. P33]ARK25635.1 hypothetical protein SporoP37_13890 [Sporosarcina sp. P37]
MKKIMYSLFILLLLTACSKEPAMDRQLKELLVAVDEKDNQGKTIVKKLTKLERKEQDLFNEAMELTQRKYPEVKQRVAALKKSAHERTNLLEKEEHAADKAKEAVERLSEWAASAGSSEQTQVEAVAAVLQKRYEEHETFVLEYKKMIDSQTQLYTQLEDREVRDRELQKYAAEVNNLLISCRQTLEEYNELTLQANRLAGRAIVSLEKAK